MKAILAIFAGNPPVVSTRKEPVVWKESPCHEIIIIISILLTGCEIKIYLQIPEHKIWGWVCSVFCFSEFLDVQFQRHFLRSITASVFVCLPFYQLGINNTRFSLMYKYSAAPTNICAAILIREMTPMEVSQNRREKFRNGWTITQNIGDTCLPMSYPAWSCVRRIKV